MGRIFYDGFDEPFRVDDVELAHLKVIIVAKLRRNERFLLRLQGGSELWVTPTQELRFHFDAPTAPPLDQERLSELQREAAGGAITVAARGTARPSGDRGADQGGDEHEPRGRDHLRGAHPG